MTTFDEFIAELEAEARSEGPAAVAELDAFRQYFARSECPSPKPLPSNPMPAAPPPGVIAIEICGPKKPR